MNNFQYIKNIILSKLMRKGNAYIVDKMRREGMKIGKDTHVYSNISLSEPYLISIGSNCTISTNVSFLTHDASIGIFADGGRKEFSDICGYITIGNNCFIGANVIVLYGVTIPDNTIVAAGSVVTKSISAPGCVIGGNPAIKIGTVDEFLKKNRPHFLSIDGLDIKERKKTILNSDKLIKDR